MPLELDWSALLARLDCDGYAVTSPVLDAAQCAELIALYDQPQHWRKTIDMARYRFGSGEYRYFAYPLPRVVSDLREAFYPRLAPLANAAYASLSLPERFPETLE